MWRARTCSWPYSSFGVYPLNTARRMGAWAHGYSSPPSSLSCCQAHNGVLHTGFFDHNAITCPPGTCTPLKYRKLNRLFRYASALPLPSVDWVAEGKVAPPRYQHGCSTPPPPFASPIAP